MSNIHIKQPAGPQLDGAGGGKNVQSEYEIAAADLAAKTARLKQLRLARDAAQQAAPPKARVKKVAKKTAKKKAPALSLSDWLKDRQVGGHNN